MPDDHYAILIGIGRYPGFGNADLKGPPHDVAAVRDWLIDPKGGDLPPVNVKSFTSETFGGRPDAPTPSDLKPAFFWLRDIAKANSDAGDGFKVGSRLYLYLSGHGFSASSRDGCLATADAVPGDPTANICPTNWLNWLKTANFFDEFVLLFDACMDRFVTMFPMPAPLAAVNGGREVGPLFEVFAATTPNRTVELSFPDGRAQGVLTWTFLDGVKGAAVRPDGMVTGHSMADWLRGAMRYRMTRADLIDDHVSKRPFVLQESDELVLAADVSPMTFRIELQFKVGLGRKGRLWSGSPATPTEFVVAASVEHRLRPGLHLVEVPEAGLRQGFVVAKDGMVEITKRGAGVDARAAGRVFKLSLVPPQPESKVEVIGSRFEAVPGRLTEPGLALPFGIYAARVVGAGGSEESIFLLDRDMKSFADLDSPEHRERGFVPENAGILLPKVASAVPFEDGRFSHESHAAVLRVPETEQPQVKAGTGGEAFITVRSWTQDGANGSTPWAGVTLRDTRGQTVADLSVEGIHRTDGDPFAFVLATLKPGTYFLRHPLWDGIMVEQALTVSHGWRTEVYLLNLGTARPPRLSVLMHRAGAGSPQDRARDERLEGVRAMLATDRVELGFALEELLVRKFENPMEGILGGHLLLKRRANGDVAMLEEVVHNLRGLVGGDHPDVQALSLRCRDPKVKRTAPIRQPPTFAKSWELMVEASRENPDLVPLSLWNRVSVPTTIPPYFAWSADPPQRRTFRAALRKAAAQRVEESQRTPEDVEAIAEILVPSEATFSIKEPGVGGALDDFARAHVLPASAIYALLRGKERR